MYNPFMFDTCTVVSLTLTVYSNLCVCVCVCVCVSGAVSVTSKSWRMLVWLLFEPIAGKNVSPSDKKNCGYF